MGWKTGVDQDKTVAGLDEVAIDTTKINGFNLLRHVFLCIFGTVIKSLLALQDSIGPHVFLFLG